MTTISAPPPRAHHGCQWGCLAVLAFIFLPFVAAGLYGGWFFMEGYRRDPVLRAVTELVRHDGMAQMALGANIHITGVEGSARSFIWGGASGGSYVVDLAGNKGAGALHVTAATRKGQLDVQSMILDGPDGSEYDLLHHTAKPSDSPTQSI